MKSNTKAINFNRINILLLAMLSICITIFCFTSLSFANEEHFSIKVTRIVDGDTFYGTYEGFPVRIRVYGIDCPEMSQTFGKEAKEALEMLIQLESTYAIELLDFDRFGRAVAIIYLENGEILQEKLLESGLAWIETRFFDEELYPTWKNLEVQARKNKTGLWQEKKPTPPWEFRSKKGK